MDFSNITVPLWAVTPEAQAFFLGFGCAAGVRIFRACLKWFKGAADNSFPD